LLLVRERESKLFTGLAMNFGIWIVE
jgi:hypothetical protein